MADETAQEILEKVRSFQADNADYFNKTNEWYKMYRSQPDARTVGKSNTFIPEVFTEIEALTTAVFEMIFSDTSDASFFDAYPEGYQDAVRAFLTKNTLADQLETVEFQRKIMPFLRGLVRDGYAPVEIPWVLEYGWRRQNGVLVRYPKYDCFDFQYIRPHNFSFSEGCNEWRCRTEIIPFARAKRMEKQGIWQNVDKALSNASPYSDIETARRQIQGLSTESKTKLLKYHEFFGYLDSQDEDFKWRVIVADNGTILRPPEIIPYDDGEDPYEACKWIEADNEPHGIGVVEINYRQQKEINDRRNYINDTLYAALYNMWKMSADCGYKSNGGRIIWEAYKVLEMDNPSGLEPLRPPTEGIPYATRLEEADRETMRRQSGATSTLQGMSQNLTATESQIVQNEATRRLRALVRSQIGTLLKNCLYKFHARNLQFLDRSRVIRAEGPEGEQLFASINGSSLSKNPYFKMKLTTDLDFRPFKRKELLEFLQGAAQLAKANGAQFDAFPIIEQLALNFNINPRDFKRELDVQRAMTTPEMQKKAVQDIIAASPGATRVIETGKSAEQIIGGMGIAKNRAAQAGLQPMNPA